MFSFRPRSLWVTSTFSATSDDDRPNFKDYQKLKEMFPALSFIRFRTRYYCLTIVVEVCFINRVIKNVKIKVSIEYKHN